MSFVTSVRIGEMEGREEGGGRREEGGGRREEEGSMMSGISN